MKKLIVLAALVYLAVGALNGHRQTVHPHPVMADCGSGNCK